MKIKNKMDITTFVKDTITSLEIATLTGKNHSHIMRDIRNMIAQLPENERETNFGLSSETISLPNGGSKQNPIYKLTKKGCLCLASGYRADLRMAIINRWEELETEKRNNTMMIPDFTNPVAAAEAWIAAYKDKQAAIEAKEAVEKRLAHQENVVEGLLYEIPLADMRQRITQIVRREGPSDIPGRWRWLYDEFNRKYHVNIYTRMNNCQYKGNKMDYIENEMHMIPELYDVACKLFENSYDNLMKEWGKNVNRAVKYRTSLAKA